MNEVSVALDRIARKNNGILRAEDVVTAARKPASPLHGCFQWDNTEAARQYRLWQARELIRVAVTVIPGHAEPTRAFISLSADRQEDGGGYRCISAVLSNPQYHAALLAEALEDARRWEAKYEALQELKPMFAARRRVEHKINK